MAFLKDWELPVCLQHLGLELPLLQGPLDSTDVGKQLLSCLII